MKPVTCHKGEYRMAHGQSIQPTSAFHNGLISQFASLTESVPLPAIALEPWQYRITSAPHPGAERYGSIWLSHARDLPVTKVQDSDGNAAGILLGFPIDLARGTCVADVWQTPPEANLGTDKGILQSLKSLGGRYLWICVTPNFARIYPDAATQISCVWDRESQSAGATALSILDDANYAARFDHAQFATLTLDNASWFPAGLTAHSGVRRLLPNHYLDLNNWTARRFEIDPLKPNTISPDEIVDGIISAIATQIAALVDHPKSPVFTLTGGYDTRVMLACGRHFASELQFVTIECENDEDMNLPKQIAKDMRLRHRILPRQQATRAGQEQYLRRSGHSCADMNLKDHPATRPLAQNHVLVGGFGGDLARAPYWHDGDTPDSPVTPALLLGRMGLLGTEKAARYLGWWLGPIRSKTAEKILDLAYLENRLGPWAMAQYCADPGVVRYAPLLTYGNIALMQALPLDWKQSNGLSRAIINRLWPDLLAYPFSGKAGLRRSPALGPETAPVAFRHMSAHHTRRA